MLNMPQMKQERNLEYHQLRVHFPFVGRCLHVMSNIKVPSTVTPVVASLLNCVYIKRESINTSNRGIGLETCILFAKEGANVLMADISAVALERASTKLKQLVPSAHKVEVQVSLLLVFTSH